MSPPSSKPTLHARRKPAPARALRQTRMRSRLAGASPLMGGLDDNAPLQDALPEGPEAIPFREVVERVRRKKLNLRSRRAAAPKEVSYRPMIKFRVFRAQSQAPSGAGWVGESYRSLADNFSSTLANSTSAAGGTVCVTVQARNHALSLDMMLGLLPRLHTNICNECGKVNSVR